MGPDGMRPRGRLLIDYANLAHRAWSGHPNHLVAADGRDLTIAHGVLSAILATARVTGATHVAIAHEHPGTSRRRALFGGYKAGRRATEADLRAALELGERVLDGLGFPAFRHPGEEADDVLASLAATAPDRGEHAFIVTADLDLVGAIGPHATLVSVARGAPTPELLTPERIVERYGVPPSRWAERKALIGDTSDAYPGCPGIGKVAAARLLADYPSLEAMRAARGAIVPASVDRRLAAGWPSVEMSHALATLRTDLPLALAPDDGALAAAGMPPRPGRLRATGLVRIAEQLERMAARAA